MNSTITHILEERQEMILELCEKEGLIDLYKESTSEMNQKIEELEK